jgi:Spy/CpxP family protein refolding chaperone
MRKTTIFLTGALLLVSSMAIAQQGSGKHYGERMAKHLELNETQSVQFKEIMGESHAKVKEIREETKLKLDAILTDEQKLKMKQMREKRKMHHEKKHERCKKGDK